MNNIGISKPHTPRGGSGKTVRLNRITSAREMLTVEEIMESHDILTEGNPATYASTDGKHVLIGREVGIPKYYLTANANAIPVIQSLFVEIDVNRLETDVVAFVRDGPIIICEPMIPRKILGADVYHQMTLVWCRGIERIIQ